ncbi:hypothetical protein [Isoptericola sp. NPDC055881]
MTTVAETMQTRGFPGLAESVPDGGRAGRPGGTGSRTVEGGAVR